MKMRILFPLLTMFLCLNIQVVLAKNKDPNGLPQINQVNKEIPMNRQAKLQKIWAAVYAPDVDVRKVIEQHFHPDYEQTINGVKLNREGYIDHVIAQKNNIVIDSIHFEQTLEKGDDLFALYFPKGKDLTGKPILGEVIAYYKFKGDQIIAIHGQVRMIEGRPSDIDMKEG